MTTVEHTPGPWSASPHASSRMGCLVSYGDMTRGENVCAVMPQKDTAVCEANARLIAAAPELLNELHNLDEWLASRTILDSGEIHNMRESIQRYIAKAEG